MDAIKGLKNIIATLTEIGLMGFVPLMLLYFLVIRLLIRARSVRTDLYDPEFVVIVGAVMAAYLSEIFFIEPRYSEFMNVLPFMLVGIVASGYERARMPAGQSARNDNGSSGRSN